MPNSPPAAFVPPPLLCAAPEEPPPPVPVALDVVATATLFWVGALAACPSKPANSFVVESRLVTFFLTTCLRVALALTVFFFGALVTTGATVLAAYTIGVGVRVAAGLCALTTFFFLATECVGSGACD